MPVLMPWAGDVAAVLHAWLPGQAMGEALADVLLGHAEPRSRAALAGSAPIPRRRRPAAGVTGTSATSSTSKRPFLNVIHRYSTPGQLGCRGDAVAIAVMVGEAGLPVQRAGWRVVAFDLQVDARHAACRGRGGQRSGDGRRQPAAPVRRVHLDR